MNQADKPRLVVVAGPNGSGKTSITERLLMHRWMQGCTYVNPDLIARDAFGDWNSPVAVMQAAEHAQRLREACLVSRTSLAFETVLSAPDKIDFIQRAKDAGFFVRVFFVGTDDPSINAQRVAIRVMEGGHDVPISKIIARYYRSIAHCADVVKIADRLYLYDNSVENMDPMLLCRFVDANLEKRYAEIRPWAQSIVESSLAAAS